jgi:hypothetical protein
MSTHEKQPVMKLRRSDGVASGKALATSFLFLLGLGVACGSRQPVPSDRGTTCAIEERFQFSASRKLDIVFTIDDSPAMQSQQEKLATQLPDLMSVLETLPGGLPDVHIAVVSSSLGAGPYPDVPGCVSGSSGNNGGRFMHPAACTGLAPDQSFIVANRGVSNFSGDIAEVFACMARLGSNGCRFPQPFAATRLALEKASNPRDADNGGFLRSDAYLAIVLLTNQDDCSIPPGSDLFDPSQTTLADRYGGLQPYRCSELGILCSGQAPPHDLPAGVDTQPLASCRSAEDGQHLSRVEDFVAFLRGLKPGAPEKILVSALAGPVTRYVIGKRDFETAPGVTERQPTVEPSCVRAIGDTGAPAVRVKSWLDTFGANGVMESVCADDFRPVLVRLAETSAVQRVSCIQRQVATDTNGAPDCRAVERLSGNSGSFIERDIPLCDAHQANFPCWRLSPNSPACPAGAEFRVCHDPTCNPASNPPDSEDVAVTCAVSPPCP